MQPGGTSRGNRDDQLLALAEVSVRFRIVVLASMLLATNVSAQTQVIDLSVARSYFQELRELGIADAGKLWGKPVHGPMLLADPGSRTVVANEPDAKGLLRNEHGVWVGALPPEMNPANTAVEFGGKKWSMVLWPVSDSRYARGRLLMHESFHRIQDQLGIPGSNPANAHLATAEGRIWTRLEFRALTEALLRSGTARRLALVDALTFRAKRRAVAKEAAEDERQLELNEGLAEYTGLVLSGLPRVVLNDRAAIQLAQSESQESLVRSFAYASGPAYALLLDNSGTPWRKNIRATSDLSEMTRRAYGITAINPADAENLIGRYNGARMLADERARETRRITTEARLRATFLDGPSLRLPIASAFNYSFNPNNATPLPGVGTIYETARVTDEWGILEVASGGVLIERAPGGNVSGVVVPNPKIGGDKITGDGWSLTLSNDWIAAAGAKKDETVVKKKTPAG